MNGWRAGLRQVEGHPSSRDTFSRLVLPGQPSKPPALHWVQPLIN